MHYANFEDRKIKQRASKPVTFLKLEEKSEGQKAVFAHSQMKHVGSGDRLAEQESGSSIIYF